MFIYLNWKNVESALQAHFRDPLYFFVGEPESVWWWGHQQSVFTQQRIAEWKDIIGLPTQYYSV